MDACSECVSVAVVLMRVTGLVDGVGGPSMCTDGG